MKINEKNLVPFSKSPHQIDREGYLMKKDKNFAKRYFVLKGNLLFYFERKNDKEPVGVIILEGSTIELTESELDEHYCFKIVFPSRSYTLSAESQQVMEQWMKSLACASYDYVKLMAAELQRQLDELTMDEAHSENPCASNSFNNNRIDFSLNANIIVPPTTTNATHQTRHVPTPPPRHRHARHQQKQNQRRSFASLHDEFGANIRRDQVTRCSAKENSRPIAGNMASLSIVKQYGVIDF